MPKSLSRRIRVRLLMMGFNFLRVSIAEVAHAHDISCSALYPVRLLRGLCVGTSGGVETLLGLSPCQRPASGKNRPPYEERTTTRLSLVSEMLSWSSWFSFVKRRRAFASTHTRLQQTRCACLCTQISSLLSTAPVGQQLFTGGEGHRGLFVCRKRTHEKHSRSGEWHIIQLVSSFDFLGNTGCHSDVTMGFADNNHLLHRSSPSWKWFYHLLHTSILTFLSVAIYPSSALFPLSTQTQQKLQNNSPFLVQQKGLELFFVARLFL